MFTKTPNVQRTYALKSAFKTGWTTLSDCVFDAFV